MTLIKTINRLKELIEENAYQNEDHIKIHFWLGLLITLEWDLLSPRELFTEYYTDEKDGTHKVDIALIPKKDNIPAALIEVKSLDKLKSSRHSAEKQMGDYIKNKFAPLSFIVDGNTLYAYYNIVKSDIDFREREFARLNFVNDTPEYLAKFLRKYLMKSELSSGNAVKFAEQNWSEIYRNKCFIRGYELTKTIYDEKNKELFLDLFINTLKNKFSYDISKEDAQSYINIIRRKRKIKEPEVISKEAVPRKKCKKLYFLNQGYPVDSLWRSPVEKLAQLLIEKDPENAKKLLSIPVDSFYANIPKDKNPDRLRKISDNLFYLDCRSAADAEYLLTIMVTTCGFKKSDLDLITYTTNEKPIE